jgi:hypothetical protein
MYGPEIWDTPGFALVLSWLAQKWNRRCHKLAPRVSKNPEQYLTKEQQKVIISAGTCSPSIPGTQPVSSNISLASFRRAMHSLAIALLMVRR